MSFKLHFLGTGCMMPTAQRNPLSVALEHEGNTFLFDCGEGTQRQIKMMKIPIGKIKRIFISHWHGDHTYGLSGLIQTLSNTDNIEKIEIYGPKDSKKFVEHTLKSSIDKPKIDIQVYELKPKESEILTIIDAPTYKIECAKLNHSTPCIGYSYKQKDTLNIDKKKLKSIAPDLEKSPLLARAKMGLDIIFKGQKIKNEDITYTKEGLKIALIFDTRPCSGVNLLAKDVDYLVMEASLLYEKHKGKADETMHMTAKETAQVALENHVKTLIITHFSQRYKEIATIEDEAKEIFENTISTYDLMTLKLQKD